MSAKDLIVLGVDPGLKSLGVCALRNAHVMHTYQMQLKGKETKGDSTARWITVVRNAIDDVHPDVIGLEDFEPQPWVGAGRVPKGAVAMQALVRSIRELGEVRGIPVYTQSPGIQAQYDDAFIVAFLRKYLGKDFSPLPHLISATKHALYADSRWHQIQKGLG